MNAMMKPMTCPGCNVGFRKRGGYTLLRAGWLTIKVCVNCFMCWHSR